MDELVELVALGVEEEVELLEEELELELLDESEPPFAELEVEDEDA